jgi:heme/copper-type cytochrome/quinol oxidase subunit 3
VAARGNAAASTLSAAEAELEVRVVSVGTWLAMSANLFFFAGWWFSFFYLRALNLNNGWRVDNAGPPPIVTGIIVLVLVILMALTYWVFSRATAGTFLFTPLGIISVLLGAAAVFLQGYRMWNLGFGMTQGGYAAVYAGTTGAWLVEMIAAVIWLATNVVQSLPGRDVIARRGEARSFSIILNFLAGVAIVNFILFYIVH